MHACIHAYIHRRYTYTRTHTHPQAHTHTRTHTRTHTHTHTRAHAHAHTRTHTHAHTHARTRARAHMYIYIPHTYVYTVRAHLHTHMCAYMYANVSVCIPRRIMKQPDSILFCFVFQWLLSHLSFSGSICVQLKLPLQWLEAGLVVLLHRPRIFERGQCQCTTKTAQELKDGTPKVVNFTSTRSSISP